MAQQDKIKREIDRIGLALAKLLGLLLHKNNNNDEAVKDIVRQTQDELNIDLPAFLLMNNNDSIQYLAKEKNFSADHLRAFANLLFEASANTTDQQQQGKLKMKALAIYEHINANANGIVYLDVLYRIKELRTNS